MTQTSLKITEDAYEAMLSHFRFELPREGCGFLVGRDQTAFRFYPIHNLIMDCDKFLMDPLHVQRTEKSVFRREQAILGVCHSHPEGECYPSRWDIEGAFFDAQYEIPLWVRETQIIALMEPTEIPNVKGFHIGVGGQVKETSIQVISAQVGKISTCT